MGQLHIGLIVQCLVVLTIANGMPVIAKKMLGEWLARPIDGGWLLWDGQPLFGRSKTYRGVVLAIGASTVGSPFVGLDLKIGALIGLVAMAGDLLSSFLKRRLRLASSAEAPELDQVPNPCYPSWPSGTFLGCRPGISWSVSASSGSESSWFPGFCTLFA